MASDPVGYGCSNVGTLLHVSGESARLRGAAFYTIVGGCSSTTGRIAGRDEYYGPGCELPSAGVGGQVLAGGVGLGSTGKSFVHPARTSGLGAGNRRLRSDGRGGLLR